jgi:alcohol dehydrogenase class IV
MHVGDYEFQLLLPRSIIFGSGTVQRVGSEAKKLGASKILIVTSHGMAKRVCMEQVTTSLSYLGLRFEIFAGVVPEPPIENADDCLSAAKAYGADLLIGLGGGSVLDVTKKVASDLGLGKIVMPTTAGTGSEVTNISVFKVKGRKKVLIDNSFIADAAIVDPALSLTMPPKLAASTGMDALAHATECYQSKRANPVTKALAMEAYTLIRENLRAAVADDPKAKANMSLASLMAGMAFGNSGTTLGHALSFPLSDEGIPHGKAVAVMLPYALEYNGFDPEIIAEVKSLIADLDITVVAKADIQEMAKIVMADKRRLANNPREVKLADVVEIYRRFKRESRSWNPQEGIKERS